MMYITKKPYLVVALILTLLFLSGTITAQEMKVGIVEFEEKNDIGIDNAGVVIPELLVSELKSIGAYQLTERVLLEKTLEEQKLQMSGLTDRETASKVGKIYNIDAVVSGSIMKVVDEITISGRVIDTETAEIIASGTITFANEKLLKEKVELLAYQLSGYTIDEYKRLATAVEISKPRYGVRYGAGAAFNSFDAEPQSTFVPLKLGFFYHSRYFDAEFNGVVPIPSLCEVSALSVSANFNPFLHFGFGFFFTYVGDEISADKRDQGEAGAGAEYYPVMAGINYRATSDLRTALYVGFIPVGEIRTYDEVADTYPVFDIENAFDGPCVDFSLEYYFKNSFSIRTEILYIGGSGDLVEGAPADYNNYMSTTFITLDFGYSFKL